MEDDCKEQGVVGLEVYDVEEGEISDSASVEEISEEAFNQQAPPPSPTPVAASAPQLKSNINSNNSNVTNNNTSGGNGARVWTMRDLYKYQISSRTSYSGLYNLAWAQAVNNKPLDEVFVMMEDSSNDNKSDGNNDSGTPVNLNENEHNKVVIDVEDEDEKEEGELEEGEIDLDSEVVVKNEDLNMDNGDENDEAERRMQVDLIKKELESLNVADPEISFERLCSTLEHLAGTLQKIALESSLAGKESLVILLLTAIKNIYNLFSSMNPSLREHNREVLSRLLATIISLKPPIFSSLQLKEVQFLADLLGNDGNNMKEEVSKGLNKAEVETFSDTTNKVSISQKKSEIESGSGGLSDQTDHSNLRDFSKSGLFDSKHKMLALPLLDLHKEHDIDSLPSPTREPSAPLPFDKEFVLGHGPAKPEWPMPRRALDRERSMMHPYETDAVKAVSCYQQKFGKSSFFMNDKLPSPTPSEDGDTGDSDMTEEVSSSTLRNVSSAVKTSTFEQPVVSSMTTSISGKPVVSAIASVDGIAGLGSSVVPMVAGPANTKPNPVFRSSSTKSRDPRLRLANLDAGYRNLNQNHSSVGVDEPKSEPFGTMSLRKLRAEEPVMDGPVLKRQRNDSTAPDLVYDVQAVTGTGGFLEDRGTVGMPGASGQNLGSDGSSSRNFERACITTGCSTSNVAALPSTVTSASPVTSPITTLPVTGSFNLLLASQNTALPVMDSNTTASLHSLLRNIAVNPSLWVNIIKMEHQKSSDHNKSISQTPQFNSLPQIVPPSNGGPTSLMLGQISTGISQTASQAVSVDLKEESGKIRMKPRDPRRILHDIAPQKSGNVGSDQLKTNTSVSSATTSNLVALRQEDMLDKKSAPSATGKPPDITRQFTKNLRNIADIIAVSPASASSPAQSQVASLPPVISESGTLRNGAGLASEEAKTCPPRPPNVNTWSDVEHLFEGFDDQQKVAIQRERARRLQEQKKMFADRKLCLVLDLDHTLLNSAKFTEVDPIHEDMLRKKEEQDREKPHRHLFRFPHMGMWTKLRPGIWNFLEKASKLYELHLYTMGNRYYATEMAKLLDPKGDLFAGRVISRGDDGELFDGDERVPKNKDLEGVLGMESGVVIIDDSVRVWPHNKLNLIVVERYIYFPCSRRQFGLPGPSLLEIDHDERPEDGTLASSLAVIEKIHQNFYAHQSLDEADVRNILASEQRKILAGCRIVFSRIFPVGDANPHMHPLWQTAEQFGATCSNQMDDKVTHVVANSLGTDKVNWALSNGRFVVHPGWVEASALLYRRANEQDFAIKQP